MLLRVLTSRAVRFPIASHAPCTSAPVRQAIVMAAIVPRILVRELTRPFRGIVSFANVTSFVQWFVNSPTTTESWQ